MRNFLLLVFASLLFCVPERDNPYDPNSKFYQKKTTLLGICQNRTGRPIPNCQITVSPLRGNTTYQALTDGNGRYELSDCPAESIFVSAEKEGFAKKSVLVSPQVYRDETLNFVLEGLPKFLGLNLFSYFCSRHIPRDSSVLCLRAEVKDEEGQGDIQRVFALIEGLADTLQLFFQAGFSYENFFLEESLSITLDEMTGRQIYFVAEDIFGHSVVSSPLRLIRVIRNPPEPISPLGGDSVGPNPSLSWHLPQYLFSYTQFVEIYFIRPNLEPILYRHYENIPPNETLLTVADSLITGYYYWQIGIKDGYNNWAKSAEAVFRVGSPKGYAF